MSTHTLEKHSRRTIWKCIVYGLPSDFDDVFHTDLFDQLSDVPVLDINSINNMDNDTLCHRLFHL